MSELTPEREAELEKCRAEARNMWRISEDCGMPLSEADKIWELVGLELRFHCSDFMRGLSIARHAQLWIESRNPSHIDAAVHLCSLAGIRPPPALAELVADVARRRLNGDVGQSTPDKVLVMAKRDYALSFMATLCAAGMKLEDAASKAAAQLLHPQFGRPYKVETLIDYYKRPKGEVYRRLAQRRRDYWNTEEGAKQKAEWLRMIPHLPEAPLELGG